MDLIQQMKIFRKIVEVGSFSEAARELGLSLSLISRQIDDLERKINTQLLQRTTRKTTPTELGEIYYQRSFNVLQEVEEIHKLLLDYKAEPQGLLKITVSHLLGQFYLSEIIPKFMEKYPKRQIKLDLSDSLVDIVGTGVDIAIRIGKMQDSGLVGIKLKSQQYIVCGTKNYLQKNGIPKSLNELKKHKAILLTDGESYDPWYLKTKNKPPKKLDISGQIFVNQGIVYAELIKKGLGLGLIYSWAVEKELQSGELIQVLPNFNISFNTYDENDIYLLFSKGRYLSTKVRVFVDFMRSIEKK